jgi:hypothetical protein
MSFRGKSQAFENLRHFQEGINLLDLLDLMVIYIKEKDCC